VVIHAGLAWGQPAAKPRKVALLVGINTYDKRGFAEQPLQFAERDVTDLKKELEKAGFQATLLTGSAKGPQRATKANIEKALTTLLQGLNSTDIVLIGLAGHGQQVSVKDKEDAFFCPVDAEKNAPETLVSLTGLMEKLDRKGGTNLVLVDACRDDPSRGVRSIAGNELQGRLPANTAVLFSCAARQQALETDQAGGGHGIFFHFVLEGLRGKAKDEDGKVTWDDLVGYVRRNVNPAAQKWFPDRAKLKADGKLQTPHMLGSLVEVPVLVDLGKASTDVGKAVNDPRAILARAIKAQGGEEFFAREPPTYYSAKGRLYNDGMPVNYTDELSTQANRFHRVVQIGNPGGLSLTYIFVFNGQKGWTNISGLTNEVFGDDLEEMREAVYLGHASRLVCLKNEQFVLSPLPEMEVNGKSAVGVKVTSKGHRDIKLYFDKETHLLAKMDCQVKHEITKQLLNEERIVLDYQVVKGIQVPKHVQVNRNGVKFSEFEFKFQFPEKFGDRVFARP
jgi:hypothetical protein